jgi:peptidyl-prolyl cis-trans isomerase D
MIRFLQKDNRVVKIIFIVIIAVAVVTMVITLVPGIFSDTDTSSDSYATVHSGGFMGRYFGTTTTITTPEVQQVAERILQQKHYPDMVLPYIMPQAAQALIQREVLLQEANRLGLQVGDADLRRAMQTGPFSRTDNSLARIATRTLCRTTSTPRFRTLNLRSRRRSRSTGWNPW